MSEDGESDGLTPADAFSVVANETRIAILRAFAREERRTRDKSPVTFSELYDRVELTDSGLFNYHLDQLTPRFVDKTEAGYELTYAGRKIVRTIAQGAFETSPEIEAFDLGEQCPECGAELLGSYATATFNVECADCGLGLYTPFPPQAVEERSRAELLHAVNRHARTKIALANDGVCPECRGRTETRITDETPAHWSYDGFDVLGECRCLNCEHQFWTILGLFLVEHPVVAAFFRDHGVDHRNRPFWSLDCCLTHEDAVVRSRDPWRVAVPIRLDGDELRVVVDGELTVREAERREATTVEGGQFV